MFVTSSACIQLDRPASRRTWCRSWRSWRAAPAAMLWCTCQTLTYVIRATDAHAKSRHTAPVRAHSPGTTAPKSAGSGREQRATGSAAGRPRRSDFVVRGQARPEGVRCQSRAADERAADGKKFGFWAPCRREAASCCPSRNLGAAAEIDDVAGVT